MNKEYIESRELMYHLDRKVFKNVIEKYKHEGNNFMVYKLLKLENDTFDRLEASDLALDEMVQLQNDAEKEGRERDAQIYNECIIILMKKMGMKAYVLEKGELKCITDEEPANSQRADKVIFYTNNTKDCLILEKKMIEKGIDFEKCEDIELMKSKVILALPALEVNGRLIRSFEVMGYVKSYGMR